MKKTIATLATVIITGVSSQVNAQTQMAKTKTEKSDSLKEYREFKAEMEKKIAENDKRIAELRTKKFEGTAEEQKKYNKRIDDLEKKNSDLRDRINNYKGDRQDMWQSFKREFNHDMKELGTALKDLGKNNVK